MKVGSLFSGIGGLDLGLERAGMEIVWQVENDPFCCKVLKKYWPEVLLLGDVKEIDFTTLPAVDLICGGFPCQPVSCAGKRKGDADERWLWPEMFRAIRELRPKFSLLENVPGLLERGLSTVLCDLASIWHDAEWETLPAAAFGSPQLRYRVFIVAYPQGSIENGKVFRQDRIGQPQIKLRDCRSNTRRNYEGLWGLEPKSRVVRMADGISLDVDNRLKALGNAVVPQVAEWIGRRIMEVSYTL